MKKIIGGLILIFLLVACATDKNNNTTGLSRSAANNINNLQEWVSTFDAPLLVQNTSSFNDEISFKMKEIELFCRQPSDQSLAEQKITTLFNYNNSGNSNSKDISRNPIYWNQVGICYYMQGLLTKARLYFNKALDVDKNFALAINNLGTIYWKEGREQKALLAWQEALKVDPFMAGASYNLARAYLKYGFTKRAQEQFTWLYALPNVQNEYFFYELNILTAARLEFYQQQLLEGLATSAFLLGDTEQALKFYSQLNAEILKDPNFGINYALALKVKGEHKAAKEVFFKINNQNLEPKLHTYYLNVEKIIK